VVPPHGINALALFKLNYITASIAYLRKNLVGTLALRQTSVGYVKIR